MGDGRTQHAELAAAPEGSKFRAGVVTNRKIRKFLIPEKSISKTDFQVKKYNFSPSAAKCTFDRSATRRVQVFCTSSLPCDAGFDFSGSERAKGSRKKALGAGRRSRIARRVRVFCTSSLPSDAGFDIFNASSSPCNTGFDVFSTGGRRVRRFPACLQRGAACNSTLLKNRYPKKIFN